MPGAALHFSIPDLSDNQDGWGPTTIPEQYKDVPYAPFNKGDRVGKASDWTGQSYKYQQGRYGQRDGTGITLFNYVYEDEDNFHLVDSKPAPRPRYGQRRFQQNRFQQQRRDQEQRRDGGREADRERQRQQKAQQKKGQWNNYWQDRNAPRVTYNSSVDIRPEWSVLEQIPLTALTKLHFDAGEPEDITTCGAVEWYDRVYDRLTPKQEKPLLRYESRQFFKVTTTEDPVIQRLANEDAGTVFATDAILATLMCAPRSVYGWDVVVQRVGDKLFFDKRDNSFDLLTVSETAQEPIPEEKDNINAVHSLSQEATFINQNFSQQVVNKDGKKYKFQEPNPFAAQNQELASCAYRYRKWKLDDKNVLVARCEIDSIAEIKGEETLMIVKALNEFDSKITGVDWRQKLDNQRGAVLATELKNNANKLAKWTSQALLAGAGMMKLGFVSRVSPRDHYNHVILGVQGYKPKEFAAQINLNVNNMWGILKSLVEICMKLDEGKYLLVKDPNKPLIRLYEVPGDAFDDDYVEEPLAEEEQEAVEPERKQEQDEKDVDADDV